MAKAFVKNVYDCTPGVPPRHINSHGWSMVTPDNIDTGAFNVFSVTEIRCGGAALPDNHKDADHCYYILSGKGYSIINGKRYEYGPNDVK